MSESSDFSQLGVRISLEAESLLNSRQDKEDIIKRLLNSGKVFVDLTDIENEIAGTPDLIRNTGATELSEPLFQSISSNDSTNQKTEVRSPDFFIRLQKNFHLISKSSIRGR